MARPSPRSRRRGRTRPGHRKIAPSPAVSEILTGDFPAKVKERVFLASVAGIHGSRVCLLCRAEGVVCRVFVPVEALRVDRPAYDGIKAYWLCQGEHSELPSDDAQIIAALTKKGATP